MMLEKKSGHVLKLEISKNFVNQDEILHYDIFIAIVWIVNY